MSQTQRTIVVMRHAKAEPAAADDHSRRLTDRGRLDAAEAGSWLAQQGIVPDHAKVSAAARTVETWQAVADGSGSAAVADFTDALYTAGPESALAVLRTAPDGARVLIYIGHNPTAAYLAHLLDDGRADPVAFSAMSRGYPTAALTVLSYDGSWADLASGMARITGFHVGAGAGR